MSYVMVDDEEVKQFQEAYLQQAKDLACAIEALKSQNDTMQAANKQLNDQSAAFEQLTQHARELQEKNKSMSILITAMVHSAGGEIIVRIDNYNDCREGKHILSRRGGIKVGDAVFMTRELPSSPLWLTKDKILQ